MCARRANDRWQTNDGFGGVPSDKVSQHHDVVENQTKICHIAIRNYSCTRPTIRVSEQTPVRLVVLILRTRV